MMKKIIRKRISLIAYLLSIGMLLNCTAEDTQNSSVDSFENFIQPSYCAPEIPKEAELFGEKIDLQNYYLRERYDRELMSFSFWHSNIFLLIKRANKFFPIIEPILKEQGIPDDFKYLVLIESTLDQRAISPAKAAGMWQILPTTAEEAGLIINEDVDERYNLEKSTVVACKFLKRTYELTNSWSLAAASYNTGRARVLKQIQQQQTNNYYEMLFSEETNRYVFRILMAKNIMENPKQFGFLLKKSDLYSQIDCDVVKVDSTINNLTDFAKGYGISYQLLKDSNPWLRSNRLKNVERREYLIKIPKKEALRFDENKIKVHNKNWVIDPQ
jgi:hypothetical protein